MTQPTISALLVTTDGAVTDLPLTKGKLLADMYKAIGCNLVEVVCPTDDLTFWFDEEGLYSENTADNMAVTRVLAEVFGFNRQVYVGHAVITGGVDDEGDTLGLTDELRERLRALLTR